MLDGGRKNDDEHWHPLLYFGVDVIAMIDALIVTKEVTIIERRMLMSVVGTLVKVLK